MNKLGIVNPKVDNESIYILPSFLYVYHRHSNIYGNAVDTTHTHISLLWIFATSHLCLCMFVQALCVPGWFQIL